MEKSIIGRIKETNIKLADLALKSKKFKTKQDFYEFVNKEAIKFSQNKLKNLKLDDIILIEDYKFLTELAEVRNMLLERQRSVDFIPEEKLPIKKELESSIELTTKQENQINERITQEAELVIPNTAAVLGKNLACKLLSLAGSLEKLSRMPSSTIQILGAEKALFRYLRGKGTPPKHGVIFLHPLLSQAKKEHRGQIARLLSNKVSLAAKVDFYKGDFQGKKLLEDIKERIEKIKGGSK